MGPTPGFTTTSLDVATGISYFNVVWQVNLLRQIVCKTNHYATKVPKSKKGTIGGSQWTKFIVQELREYIGVYLLMGIKNLNLKSYWAVLTSFLHCLVISFESIIRYLHMTNFAILKIDTKNPRYDKINKIKWLVDDIKTKF